MRRVLLAVFCIVLPGVAGCGDMPYDCGGVRGIITEVNSVEGFWNDSDEYYEAEPGHHYIEVVIDPSPAYAPRNIGYRDCTLELADSEGNRYPRSAQGWYGTTQQYKLYYQVPDTAAGFRLGDVDLGL